MTAQQVSTTRNLVKIVSGYLQSKNINVPFFIAGGSVFSAFTDTDYDDIDVYFYNPEDLNRVVSMIDFEESKSSYSTVTKITSPKSLIDLVVNMDAETETSNHITANAITVSYTSQYMINNKIVHKIQFIKKSSGTIEETFNRFDINCSRVSIDSFNYMHYDESWGKNIHINHHYCAWDTFSRYTKYVTKKGAIDLDQKELKRLIDFFVENHDKDFICYYDNNVSTGMLLLIKEIEHYQRNLFQYTHDSVVKYHDEDTQLFLFGLFEGDGVVELDNISDTFVTAFKIKKDEKAETFYNMITFKKLKSLYPRASLKFPEYFI